MSKVLGIGKEGHGLIAAVFLILFFIGIFSADLSFESGDYSNGLQTLAICSTVGLVPALIFLYFASKLARQDAVYAHLASYLHGKQRCSLSEVARDFNWTEPEAEERIVAAISENFIQGHFDRGSKQFAVLGSQQNMTFVEKCANCGAPIGMWVSSFQPSACPYCQSDPRGHFQAPAAPPPQPMYGPQPGYPQAYPPGPMAQYPYQPMVGPAPPQPYYPPSPYPPQQQYAPPQPQPSVPSQRKNITIKFLFFSAKSGTMKTIGFVLLLLGVIILGALISITPQFDLILTMGCGVIFYLPLLLIGAVLVWKAFVHEKYKDQLLDIADYLVTYRQISFLILARKMNLPEDRVRKIIDDIIRFQLLDGQVTPDGKEFVMRLRPEDVQTVTRCPYCTNPSINVQVIRGGSQKCPFCGGVIYFTEAVSK